MSTGAIILLGAFAGFTIYLGLPLAFLEKAPQKFKTFCNMLATGILVFLFYDVIGKASEKIEEAITSVQAHQESGGTLAVEVVLLIVGVLVGLLGLVYFNKYVLARYKPRRARKTMDEEALSDPIAPTPALVGAGQGAAGLTSRAGQPSAAQQKEAASPNHTLAAASPRALALMIAVGIGLHNFSEGLAIGQSAATGALSLAAILIIGFGLHNMTEGFGIAGPLANQRVSWRFIVLLGLIGGGPTFLGTVVGIIYQSPQIFILFLALAAGSILYVVAELLALAKRTASAEVIMWGLAIGFFLGYLTDLILTYAGA
ncbi:MAG TPA: ZIP family metal transporter [Ktedonobacterales bacterium]|jgi:ZIP family zinc transporter